VLKKSPYYSDPNEVVSRPKGEKARLIASFRFVISAARGKIVCSEHTLLTPAPLHEAVAQSVVSEAAQQRGASDCRRRRQLILFKKNVLRLQPPLDSRSYCFNTACMIAEIDEVQQVLEPQRTEY
jgi:hypothetical protein